MYEWDFDCLYYDARVRSHSLSALVRTGQYLEHLASFYLLLSMEPSERISRPPLEKYITHIYYSHTYYVKVALRKSNFQSKT